MYIRRVTTRRTESGETYHSYRLVESRRDGARVRQVTLLNLGRHFEVPEDFWPGLCARLGQLLGNQAVLLPVGLPESVETMAQALAAQFVARAPLAAEDSGGGKGVAEFATVDVASLDLVQPRSVGVEHVGLHALAQLELEPFLASLGINAVTRRIILMQVVARMAAPGSELATWGWLNETSALPELLELSLTDLSLMRLYRAADVLVKHQAAIETHLFERVKNLFSLAPTVTLFDLTNTWFEGDMTGNAQAKRGHSKEKRSDCPLLTLGLVLDSSGFVRRSKVLAGNAVESRTLAGMLDQLGVAPGGLVVMDAGIATEANLLWLKEQKYRYLVVSRERNRRFPEGDVTLTTAGQDIIQVEKVLDEAAGEVRLYCHSPRRELKETGINERFCRRFEAGLTKLAAGLSKPRGAKHPDVIRERIGRLKQASFGVGRHYAITVETDATQTTVTGITWKKQPVEGSMLTDPGTYCLRSNETTWNEEQLWRTYIMLTDLESVFRSLKSELGLRPIHHHKQERGDGHLFITVLAYQCVQLIRRALREKGITERWSVLRRTLTSQRRVTAQFKQQDGRTLSIRKATQPEAKLQAIYQAIGLNPLPGSTKKFLS